MKNPLVIFNISLAIALSPQVNAAPWQLGTITNVAPNASCVTGYTCRNFKVINNPGVATSVNGTFAAAQYRGTPKGVVMFFTGGEGTTWWTDQNPELWPFADDLRNQGFTIVQVKWSSAWLNSSPGNDAGTAHLGGRPATVIKYIYDRFYVPLGITKAQVATNGGGFIITGNSGGSSQVGYAISHYGLDTIVDAAIPTGGPPHASLAKAMLAQPGNPYFYDAGTRAFIDKGFGFFNNNGPGYLQNPSFTPRWQTESHSTGGNDYDHPTTRVHFIIGELDTGMQTQAADYVNRLWSTSTGPVAYEIAPGTPHPIFSTAAGRAALRAAILWKP